mgnify:CR=1 FL=1
MATEILNLEVKTEIKGAVKEIDNLSGAVKGAAENYAELSEQVAVQNEYIAAQETELVRLKSIQDSIPKGSWFAGQSKLAEDINNVTSEIRSEKDALKKLKGEQKDVAKAIRDKTAAQKKDTNAAIRGIQHFQVMGVSIRKLKYMVRGVIPMFKLLFTTIKSGIISTGIGALVLALIAIGTSMKSSVAGGKAFKAMMGALGVVTGAVTDALTFLGDTMLSVFGFDSSTDAAITAANNLEQAYKDLGLEMDNINLRKAETGREELKNQQIINDITASEEERLEAAWANYKITSKNNRENLHILKMIRKADIEAIALNKKKIKQATDTGEGLDEALSKEDKLIKKKNKTLTDIANIRLKMDKAEIDNINTINKIKETQIKKNKQANKDQVKADALTDKEKAIVLKKQQAAIQELIDLETDRINNQIINSAKLLDDFYTSQLEAQDREKNAIIDKWNFSIQAEEEGSEKRIELEEAMQSELSAIDKKYRDEGLVAEEKNLKAKLDAQLGFASASGKAIGALGNLAKEGSDASKALALTEIAVNTGVGIMQGLDIAQKSAKATGPGAALAFPIFFATQLAAVLGAAASAKQVFGGGGTTATVPDVSVATPAPQMMSGAFELTGGEEVEPARAYVVSDDITDSQNGLAIIRRRATI